MIKWLIRKISANPTLNDGPRSPLGWSVGTRLLWAAGASVLLWLCVAWALGW